VIEFTFSTLDLTRTRFAFSALNEVIGSVSVLRAPARHALHLPWVEQARERVAGIDLTMLYALVPSQGYVPDFLTPPRRRRCPPSPTRSRCSRARRRSRSATTSAAPSPTASLTCCGRCTPTRH
jgi:hypothetical protein